ncbi:hypothetical protein [Entomobacter blattae]|uniref:hypothetical protein n=1 Tax=Entomobacter blattae TaxID=2762277 RepID=UPI00193B1069|nr:hypothetical protein [Entomobacter blattae]
MLRCCRGFIWTMVTEILSSGMKLASSLQTGSILTVGHSARDTFAMLHQQGVVMHVKPFNRKYLYALYGGI